MTEPATPAAGLVPLASDAELDAALAAPLAVIFKHSTSCNLSAMAHDEVRRYLGRPDATRIALLKVIESRPVSNAVEERTGIRHESPQVLVLRNGAVVWHASHRRVTAEAIAEAVASAQAA